MHLNRVVSEARRRHRTRFQASKETLNSQRGWPPGFESSDPRNAFTVPRARTNGENRERKTASPTSPSSLLPSLHFPTSPIINRTSFLLPLSLLHCYRVAERLNKVRGDAREGNGREGSEIEFISIFRRSLPSRSSLCLPLSLLNELRSGVSSELKYFPYRPTPLPSSLSLSRSQFARAKRTRVAVVVSRRSRS